MMMVMMMMMTMFKMTMRKSPHRGQTREYRMQDLLPGLQPVAVLIVSANQ